jgi:hypothetical protein
MRARSPIACLLLAIASTPPKRLSHAITFLKELRASPHGAGLHPPRQRDLANLSKKARMSWTNLDSQCDHRRSTIWTSM